MVPYSSLIRSVLVTALITVARNLSHSFCSRCNEIRSNVCPAILTKRYMHMHASSQANLEHVKPAAGPAWLRPHQKRPSTLGNLVFLASAPVIDYSEVQVRYINTRHLCAHPGHAPPFDFVMMSLFAVSLALQGSTATSVGRCRAVLVLQEVSNIQHKSICRILNLQPLHLPDSDSRQLQSTSSARSLQRLLAWLPRSSSPFLRSL